ncbi:hypothetical protein [Albidovulum sediminis]|uniref:Uncharacterized protein n=1 Tax=Albidovulum sediminis TaxID=3066345 RepID=A0ABT2NMC5_9RHOB|nr:hypothetical protein [Defluviimonas sediminis]MCT8329865.1 hypothetical protein [Defluviimonas sediminis]
MARGILIAAPRRAAWSVLAFLAAWPAFAEPDRIRCRGGGAEGLDLVRVAVASPFYRWLAARHGTAETCRIRRSDGRYDAVLGFADTAAMTIVATPEIGAASYEASATTPPTAAEAAALLAAMDHWVAGPGGCGLSPAHLRAAARSTAPETVVEGHVCNCRATVRRGAAGIAALSFGSAC